MKGFDNYMEQLSEALPEICRVKDLVNTGIFSSPSEVCHYKKLGLLPPYLQLREGGRVLFNRIDVIEWMKTKVHNGDKKIS